MADSTTSTTTLKRKRSPSISAAHSNPPAPTSKPATAPGAGLGAGAGAGAATSAATQPSHLQINYIARQCNDDLPLIDRNETIPGLVDVLAAYNHVLDRHESLASNLGARPLGPILIKRFERCFEEQPLVIATHSHNRNDHEAPHVTWLDVVQFARAHPAQFTLSTFSEGRHVCQFYYPQKQVRVQVTEEDYLFIKSGRCEDLIPPLPIWEDEEKEVGTCEILEKTLREVTNAADMVAARTRQLSHRLKSRRLAILDRRAGQLERASDLPPYQHEPPQAVTPPASAARGGFTAVNAQPQSHPPPQPPTNGVSTAHGLLRKQDDPVVSASIRADLAQHFQSLQHSHGAARPDMRRPSGAPQSTSPVHQAVHNAHPTDGAMDVDRTFSSTSVSPAPPTQSVDPLSYYLSDAAPAPVAIPRLPPAPSHSNSGKHNFSKPLPPDMENTQPFRNICQAYMESLPRGSRIMPPCDRCRRLRMDCLKNLTSCSGCTKKHARCHWRQVTRGEVGGLEHFNTGPGTTEAEEGMTREGIMQSYGKTMGQPVATSSASHASSAASVGDDDDEDDDDDDRTPLDDLEALERRADDERAALEEDAPGAVQSVQKHGQGPNGSEQATQLARPPSRDGNVASEQRHVSRNIDLIARVEDGLGLGPGPGPVEKARPQNGFAHGLPLGNGAHGFGSFRPVSNSSAGAQT